MNVRDTIHQPKKSYVYGNQREAETPFKSLMTMPLCYF